MTDLQKKVWKLLVQMGANPLEARSMVLTSNKRELKEAKRDLEKELYIIFKKGEEVNENINKQSSRKIHQEEE